MPLQVGTRLGPYEITSHIGAGGMGEVFRARDTKLQRDVAIKVLPELFAADPDRLARFEREAQALAALNHPYIAQIYGVLDLPPQGGSHVIGLVMEFVDGEDLSQRLSRGAMPLDEALAVAAQIAAALEAAHERGIVHRDLKPGNVKVTADGTVKVLDFGLAKAVTQDSGPPQANSPTFTSPAMTELGVILGTAAYMAPEQARGKAIDKRADIWAFGAVLYEMLTGRQPFDAETITDTLAAIVRADPEWSMLPTPTPPVVTELLRRCLEKDPKQRLRDIGEARIALSGGPIAPPAPPVALRAPGRTSWAVRTGWLAAGLVVGAAVIALAIPRRPASPPAVLSLRQLTEAPGPEINPDISPDGRQVLYAASSSGNSDLYLLRVGGGRAINLTANSPADDAQGAFSPDGERIAFRSARDGGGIFVMGATGESVRRITVAGFDPRWSPDGNRLAYATEAVRDPYSRSAVSELWTVDVASGAATSLFAGDAVQPTWSPRGTRIAFWSNTGGQRDIWTIAASGGAPVAVTTDAATDWAPEWAPDGKWLYFVSDRGGSPNLWRVAIDERTGAPSGEPQPITNGVRALGSARFARDGSRMVIGTNDRSFELALYAFDPAHPERVVPRSTTRSASLGWCGPSPDGAWLACTSRSGQEDLVLLRSDGTETRRITDDAFKDRIPTWSPDGHTLAFMSTRSGGWEQWTIGVDGSGLRQMTNIKTNVGWAAWAPDGKQFALTSFGEKRGGIWFVDPSRGSSAPEATTFVPAEVRVGSDSWSSDGELIAGNVIDRSGDPRAISVWDVKAVRLRRQIDLPLVRGTSIDVNFVPGTHQLLAHLTEGMALVDADTGSSRVILKMAPPFGMRLSGDGRTLLIERPSLEADLWLMEFKK